MNPRKNILAALAVSISIAACANAHAINLEERLNKIVNNLISSVESGKVDSKLTLARIDRLVDGINQLLQQSPENQEQLLAARSKLLKIRAGLAKNGERLVLVQNGELLDEQPPTNQAPLGTFPGTPVNGSFGTDGGTGLNSGQNTGGGGGTTSSGGTSSMAALGGLTTVGLGVSESNNNRGGTIASQSN